MVSWKEKASSYILQDKISKSQVDNLANSAVESCLDRNEYINYYSNSLNEILISCNVKYIISVLYVIDGIFKLLHKKRVSDEILEKFNVAFTNTIEKNEKKIIEQTPESDCRRLIKLFQFWVERCDLDQHIIKRCIYRISSDLGIDLNNIENNNSNNNTNNKTTTTTTTTITNNSNNNNKRYLYNDDDKDEIFSNNFEIDDILEPELKYQKLSHNNTANFGDLVITPNSNNSREKKKNLENQDYIYILPIEMFYEIFSYLSLATLSRLARVSKFFRYITSHLPCIKTMSFDVNIAPDDIRRTLIQFNMVVKVNLSFNKNISEIIIQTIIENCHHLENINISGCTSLDFSIIANLFGVVMKRKNKSAASLTTTSTNKARTGKKVLREILHNVERGLESPLASNRSNGSLSNHNNNNNNNIEDISNNNNLDPIITKTFKESLKSLSISQIHDQKPNRNQLLFKTIFNNVKGTNINSLRKLDISCCHGLIFLIMQDYKYSLSNTIETLNIDCYCKQIDVKSYSVGLLNLPINFPNLKKLYSLVDPGPGFHSLSSPTPSSPSLSPSSIISSPPQQIQVISNCLWKSVLLNDYNQVNFLLQNEIKSTINKRYLDGTTALYMACKFGYVKIIDLLLEKDYKCDWSIGDQSGLTPLTISENIFIAQRLLEKGVKAYTEFEINFVKVCEILLKYHSFLNRQSSAKPQNPLIEEFDQLLKLILLEKRLTSDAFQTREIFQQNTLLICKFIKNFDFFRSYIESSYNHLKRHELIYNTLKNDEVYERYILSNLDKTYQQKVYLTLFNNYKK